MIEYQTFEHTVYETVNKDNEEEFLDKYVFRPIPSDWEKGKPLYTTTIFLEQSLYDLNYRMVRSSCNCWDYKSRKRKCKHIKDAEKQLNKFIDITDEEIPVQ